MSQLKLCSMNSSHPYGPDFTLKSRFVRHKRNDLAIKVDTRKGHSRFFTNDTKGNPGLDLSL